MSRSELVCPECKQQIGWRKGSADRRFFPAVRIVHMDELSGDIEYVCPHCGAHCQWTHDKRTEPKAA